jgi:hypothetical protein
MHRFWRTIDLILQSKLAGARWNTAINVSAHGNFDSMPMFMRSGSNKAATDETVMWGRIKIETERATIDTLPIWCFEPRLCDPQLSLL